MGHGAESRARPEWQLSVKPVFESLACRLDLSIREWKTETVVVESGTTSGTGSESKDIPPYTRKHSPFSHTSACTRYTRKRLYCGAAKTNLQYNYKTKKAHH
ncbi:hypothetical protein EVAR_13255_1 [Eumeta japonica]|uniref:Uncharacterized protein n=1 Tax=Eumeta variegata TaxID=151549 RepID=A0A4C1YQP6_EUMVA|nr:hypothetical protein EVAR_13255_1 [Eumeta japonica]